MPLHYKGGMDDDFSGRIKNIEDKLRGTAATEKKPRDLLRAIGELKKKKKIDFLAQKIVIDNLILFLSKVKLKRPIGMLRKLRRKLRKAK